MRVLSYLVPWFLILQTSPLYAGIFLLTPVSGKTTPSKQILLVVQGPGSGVKIRTATAPARAILLKRVPLKGKNQSIYHFRLTLPGRKNTFYLLPGEVRFSVSWNPAISIARPERFPNLYLFHRGATKKACLPCHKGLTSLSKGKEACLPCHRDKVAPPKDRWVHGPTALTKGCFTCHGKKIGPKGIRFTPFKGGSDALCFQCHVSNRRWKKERYVHGPVGAGNCVFCHDPHNSTRKYFLKYDGKEGLCFVCHLEKAKELSVKGVKPHAILSAEGCTICHNPHASPHPYQLRKATVLLCVGCHPWFAGRKRGHPITNHPLVGPRDPLHSQKKFTCVSCHIPHGSQYRPLLIAPRGMRLCSRCHPYQ